MKKILLSTTAAILVATAVNAGTVTSNQVTVASELNTLPASIDISDGFMDENTTAYVPSTISLTDLSNPIFNIFTASTATGDTAVGTIDLVAQAGKTYCIVEDVNNSGEVNDVVIAVATTTSGSKLSFDGTAATATNAHKYMLRAVLDANATVNTVITAGDSFPVVDGNLTVSGIDATSYVRVNLGSGDTNIVNDRAGNLITTSGAQMSVTMNTLFDGVIDSTNNSYTFTPAATADLLDFNVTAADKTLDAVGANDDMTVLITSTNALPAAADYNLTEAVGGTGEGSCTLTNANLLTCTLANAGLSDAALDTQNYTVTITVNGTSDVLLATEFGAEIAYNFDDSDASDYVESINPLKDLTTAGEAGEWTYYGYNAIIPSINTSTGNTTYLKFNNDSNNNAYTYWTVTGYDGCKTSSLVQADAMTFNGTGFDTLTDGTLGAGVSGLWNATDIITAANASGTPLLANGTTTACTLNERSSIEVLVTTTRNLVHGTATMRVAGQSDKIIPILTRNEDGINTNDYLSE